MSLLTLTLENDTGVTNFSSAYSPVDGFRAPLIVGLSGCLAALSIFVVVLRCYCRGRIESHFWHDDYLIVFATICSIIVLACFIGESYNGLGRDILFLSSGNREYLAKIGYIHEIFDLVGIHAVKISFCCFILRTISGVKIRNSSKGMIAFVLVFMVFTTGIVIFQCVPAAALWDAGLESSSRCLSLKSYVTIGLVTDSVNAIIDLIFSTLPLPFYYDSNASKYSRVALMGIVALAYIACSAAIVKVVRRAHVLTAPSSWRESDYTLWTNIELQIGILGASLPTLTPIFTIVSTFICKTVKAPKWPTNNYNTQEHISARNPIRMGPTPLRRHSRSTLYRHHAGSVTTEHSDPEQQHITRYPSSRYKVEVSASNLSGSNNGTRRDIILVAAPSGFPAIMRTTDVYIHTADGNKGDIDEEDVDSASAEIRSVS